MPYARAMEQKEDQRRIAELEQEVSRLRGELGSREADDPGDDVTDEELAQKMNSLLPSRRRAIVIASAAGVVALVAIIAIVIGISSAIGPFSRTAAEAISPWEEGMAPRGKPGPKVIKVRRPAEDTPRAPGL